MSNFLKIIFIPLDNRPVSYSLPQQIASLNKNIQFLVPPRTFLGGLTEYSDINNILKWLDETLITQKVDYIIISLDTIAYGGLISSRRSINKSMEIIERLNYFRNIIEKNSLVNENHPKLLAFSSIMRISDSDVNEEEKEYWDKFGKEIFKYSYLKHKTDLKQASIEEEKILKNLIIPAEILDDYLKTRERNFSVNRFYLSWIEEKFLDFLVFSKDDTGEFGINVLESEALDAEIRAKKLSDSALTQTGADEIPCNLISRALVDNYKIKIKLFPIFSTENGKNIISRYEDKTIFESVAAQIKTCGGELAASEEDSDLILLVHTPLNIQNDHCLRIYPETENKEAINYCINFIKNSEKPLIIGDIANANGGDNLLVVQILEKVIDLNNIYGYAGWNTTGNTLGSVISIGISRFIAEQTNSFELENFKKILLIRFCDDWAYQTIVRQIIRATIDFADKTTLIEELTPFVINLAKKIDYKFNLLDLKLEFPWNRTFEVELII